MSSSSTSTPAATPRTSVKEYSIIVPKNVTKKYHVMRFNATLGVEFDKWTQVKMERENNMREFKGTVEEEQPKFGAGSEYGREAKEEARRKKLGIMPKKYKPDAQPWILKSSGSTVKKFKGIREGGVSENAAYYVFTHAANNIIQAFPLNEWYKFQTIHRYKALSSEEAEQEFTKRNQHMNFFSLMLRKRLRGEEEAILDGEGEEKGKGKKTSKAKELKISEMDEWMESSDDDSDDEEGENKDNEEEKAEKKKQKGKKNNLRKKKKKRDTDGEAFEDSDDGDGEGRELDYITDSSESEAENTKLEGVSEEKALRKLLNSDEEEDSDSDKSEKDEKEKEEEKDEKEKKEKEEKPKEAAKSKKKKKKEVKKDTKDVKNTKDDNSDFSSDSSTDEEVSKKKAAQKSKKNGKEKDKITEDKKADKEVDSPNSSRSASPTNEFHKRKLLDAAIAGGSGSAKKSKMDVVNYIPGASESGITEDAVRKYLMRKPMTTTELLQKFKSKKTGLSSEQLVNIMTQILKKINPVKQMLKGKMYLSIKS